MEWENLLKLFKDNPEYMLIAFIVLAIIYFMMNTKNHIGKISSKNTKVSQSGLKPNNIDEIESSENTHIEQKD